MNKKLTVTEQEELFTTECKLINLKYEYQGYTGDEKWAIVSELTEKELFEKYPDVIKRYMPFVLLSIEQGQTIATFNANEDKYKKRMLRSVDMFGYDDELSSQFHNELCSYDETLEEINEQIKREILLERQINALKEGIDTLTETQKRRLIAVYLKGKTSREVAKEENVNYSAVDKSITQSLKKLKIFLENRVCKMTPLSK